MSRYKVSKQFISKIRKKYNCNDYNWGFPKKYYCFETLIEFLVEKVGQFKFIVISTKLLKCLPSPGYYVTNYGHEIIYENPPISIK